MTTVAHELRSPLTSLRLSLDMLVHELDDLPPHSARQLLERARRSAAWLHALTENLTDVAAAQGGHLEVNLGCVDVRECVDEAVTLVRGMLDRRGQTVRVSSATQARLVKGDRARLIQVVANLLSNANRYSIDGDELEVHISAGPRGYMRVCVADHGPGIAPEDQQRIFDAWQQGPASPTGTGGLGLGLNIVHNLVQRMGGQVGVDSRPGHGATFWFTLEAM